MVNKIKINEYDSVIRRGEYGLGLLLAVTNRLGRGGRIGTTGSRHHGFRVSMKAHWLAAVSATRTSSQISVHFRLIVNNSRSLETI